MKLINQLALIGVLLFVVLSGAACDKGKFEEIVNPEVKVIMREVRIAVPDNADISQCKDKVYQITGVFNDDSSRPLTDQEISKYVTWQIPNLTYNPATTWTCDGYSVGCAPPDTSSDITEDTGAVIPWHRCLNRIRFDKEGEAKIKIEYKDDSAGPFYSERTLQIKLPKLVKIDVEPTSDAHQLRGNETRAPNPSGDLNDGVFGVSDNGVCEGVANYQADKLVVGCVKRFTAQGTYDNDETRNITTHVNMAWDEDSTLDSTSDKPAVLYGAAPTPTVMTWPYDGDNSFQNKDWYRVTYNYLSNPANVSADAKKSMFFGLRPNTFRAKASMDGVLGYSGNIEVIGKSPLTAEIKKPQKDPTFDLIEEQVIQLQAIGLYDNDTTEDITRTVTWGSKDQSRFIIRPEDGLGQIYAKPFFKNSDSVPPLNPTGDGPYHVRTAAVKANISGLPDATIDLKVRQKRLKYVDIEMQGFIQDSYTVTYNQKAPMALWAVYDNDYIPSGSGVSVGNDVNKKNVATCAATDWVSSIRTDVAVVIDNPTLPKCQLNTDGDKGTLLGKSVDGNGNITAEFTGANTTAGTNVKMTDTVQVIVQPAGSRVLKGIQITPFSVAVTEGETITLNLWEVYDDQTMKLSLSTIDWDVTPDSIFVSNVDGVSGGATIDVNTNNVDATTEVQIRARHPVLGRWSEKISIFINDIRLRSVETGLIKPWVTDISGDFAELSVLGTFGGFVKNGVYTRIAAGASIADSTTDHTRLLGWHNGGADKEVTFDYNPAHIKDITYDSAKGVFRITPQDIISAADFITTDITVATAINPSGNILNPAVHPQKELRKTVSLKIYDSIKVYFDSTSSAFGEGVAARVKLRLSHAADKNTHIPFSFLPGPSYPASGDGVDYDDGIGLTAVVPAGDTSVDVVFNLVDDAIGEYPETVKLQIRAADLADATIGANSSHVLTINDNDTPLVYFDAPSLYVNEVSGDTTPKIHLKLSKISDVTASVNYSIDISDASSTVNANDYSDLKGGNIKIQPGQNDASFDIVKILDDSLHEIDEYLVLKITDVTIDLAADRTVGVLGFDTTSDPGKPTRQLITIVDNDYFNIGVNIDSTSSGHTAINSSGDHLITNTGTYYFKPHIPVDTTLDYPKVFRFYNTPGWATYDINTGVLQGKPGKPSRYEVGTYPANFDKVIVCVSDATSESGAETSCLDPFNIHVKTCLSSQNGSIRQSSTFGGDINCGKVDNHVTVEDHTVDWNGSKFSGIALVEPGGALKLSGLVDGDVTSGAYMALRGGALQVVGDSVLNASVILEVSSDSTIDVAGGQTLTYKGPSVKIESLALNIPGDGTIDATAGVVMNNGSLLRLGGSGGAIVKVDVSGDSTIDVSDRFAINNLAVPNSKLKLSGAGHLALNAVVDGTIDAAQNGKLSGKIIGAGELDISGDTLTLGGDLTIDINKLTSSVDATIDTDANRLEWDGRNGLNNLLKGKVVIDNQGVFRLIDNAADISADIRLNGGRLEVNQSAILRKDITVDANSVIKTSSLKTLTYKGRAVELNHTLSLEGLGGVDSDATATSFIIKPAGILKIDGNPKLQKPIRLSGGALEVNNDCSIDKNFVLDPVESNIQINSGWTLDYTPTVSLDVNNSLRLTGAGFLNNSNAFRLGGSGLLKLMDGGKIDKVTLNHDSARVRADGAYTINFLVVDSNIGKIDISSSGELTTYNIFELLTGKTLDISADVSGRKVNFPNKLTLAGGTLNIKQSIEVSGDINMSADSSIDVLSGKTMTHAGGFSVVKNLFLKGGGDISKDSLPLTIGSNGALIVEASSDIRNAIELSGGSLNIRQSTAISGNISQTASSVIDVSSDKTFKYGGNKIDIASGALSLTGDGTMDDIVSSNEFAELLGGGMLLIAGNWDISGDIVLNGGTLKTTADPTIYGNITQKGDASVDIASGNALTYKGAPWRVGARTLSLTGQGTLVNNNKLSLNNVGGLLVLGGDGSMDALAIDVTVNAPIRIDNNANFKVVSLNISEDTSIDVADTKTLTIANLLTVPANKKLCVTGPGTLLMNGGLILQGDLCASEQSAWSVNTSDVSFDGGSISGRGDSSSRNYKAKGVLNGEADLRGVLMALAGDFSIQNASLIKTDSSTHIATGANTFKWDGKGGALDGLIDVSADGTFDIFDSVFNDASIDATVNLAGGVWKVYINTSLRGDLIHSLDSSIDVFGGKTLKYTGSQMNIGGQSGGLTLSLIGSGSIDNSADASSHTFKFNDSTSVLSCVGNGGRLSRVDVATNLVDPGKILVGVNDFTLQRLGHSSLIKVDIGSGFRLNITDPLYLATGDTLNFIAPSGGGNISFGGGLLLKGGRLDVSQDLNVSAGSIEVTGDATSVINVANNKSFVYGNTLEVSGDNTLSLGGPIGFDIRLAGGVLAVESSADLNGNLTHTASSDINVSSGAVLNYKKDASMDIGSWTLSLTGGGTVNTSPGGFCLDTPNSVLNLSGTDGTIDQVDVSADLTGAGKIKVESNFQIKELNKLPGQTTVIDISPDVTLTAGNFVLNTGETLKFASSATGGDGILNGSLKLNGGELIVDQNLTVSGDITQDADGTIDVASGRALTYSGANWFLGPNTLYLVGSGRIKNADNIVLNHPDSRLWLTGVDGSIDSVDISVDGTVGYRSIESRESFKIGKFTLQKDTSIDIASAKTLKILNGFTVPNGVTLKVTGDGTLDVNGQLITLNSGGVFRPSGDPSIAQYFNINSVSDSTFDATSGVYHLRGSLAGTVKLSDSTITLDNDLAIAGATLSSSGAEISTASHTLTWDGSSALSGVVRINKNGTFTVSRAGTIGSVMYLSGGVLDIDANTVMNGNLIHDASSSIDVANSITFTYGGASMDINPFTLSLTGPGVIQNSAHAFLLNNTKSVLKCSGSGGKIAQVGVAAAPASAGIDIDHNFRVDQLDWDATVDLAAVDIGPSYELTVGNSLELQTGKTLRFMNGAVGTGKLTLLNGLSLNGGLLDVDQSLDVSGDFRQSADSTIDIVAGKFMGYNGKALDISHDTGLNDLTLHLAGDSSLDISLDGGILRIKGPGKLYGDITNINDSTIDLSSDIIYGGEAVNINGHTLSFTGTSKFDNSGDNGKGKLVLNNKTGKLWLKGTSIYIGWVEVSDSTSAVAVSGDATVDKFAMTEDVSFDINTGFALTVNKGFVVPNAKRLILYGDGGTFMAKDATVELQGGTLETALKGNLYMDISMDSSSRFKRGAGPISQQDNKYWLKGTLSGNIDLSGANVRLLGDLNFVEVMEMASELSLFSTEGHAFDWGGDTTGGWSPTFRGSLDISADGVFRVSQGPLKFKNNENSNYLRLFGGSLVINDNSCDIDMSIDHAASSDINVASGVTFNIDKARGLYDLKIGKETLSLTGPGYVAGSAYIVFDSSAGVLRLAGNNGKVKQVKIPQSMGAGKLDVDAPFMIEALNIDGLSGANVNIDISSDASLDVEATVDVIDVNSLVFIGRDGTFDADLSFNGGKLIIQEDSVFRGDISHAGSGEIDFGANKKTLTYKGKTIEIGANALTLTGDGSFDNNNNNPIFLDHKDSKLYLSDSAWARLIKIGGDLNGNSLIDIYVNEDATIDAFDMSQDSNIHIAAGKTLTVNSSVNIPANKRLIISGGGVMKVNGTISLAGGGSLLPSGNSSFYADESGVYHIAGVLAGNTLNLENKKVVLEGNLTINVDNLLTNSGTDISTGSHTLSWNGQSPLHGKIHVQSGGQFQITGGANTMDATIDLDGGFLEVDYDLTVTSDINLLSDSSIDVADGVIFVYEGSDISVGTNSLSMTGPGFFYNDKDNLGNSHIVMDKASSILRLSGDNGIVNSVKVVSGLIGGKALAENDYVILRLLLAGSPFKVEVAANKNLIIGDELKVASGVDVTIDISGAGRLLLHDVIMEANLDINTSIAGNLVIAPDATLRVVKDSVLASNVDLEFGDGLYIHDSKVLTVRDNDNAYTLTFGGGVTFAGTPAPKPIVLVGDESLVFNDPVAAESIVSLVDTSGVTTGTVSPNPYSTPKDVVEFKAQPSDNVVNLSWRDQAGQSIAKICRSTSGYDSTSDCSQKIVYEGTNDSSADNDVSNDARYYYTAFGSDGSKYSKGVKVMVAPTFVGGDLVGYYRFDDAPVGKILDDSGWGNEGLVFGAFEQTSDMKSRANKAYVFDGVDDYFEIDNPFESAVDFNSAAGSFSLSLWLKTDQKNGAATNNWYEGSSLINGRVNNGDNDFGLTIADGRVMFGTGGVSPQTIKISERVDDGRWHNITAVRDSGGALNLYLDGKDASSGTGLTGSLNLPAFLGIGARPFGGKLYQGYMDDARLYNVALSANDAKKIYAQSQSLTAYYRLDNNGNDDSGFNNHGTPNNVDSSAGINAKPDSAYQFISTNLARVEVADNSAFKHAKELSYSLWAYFPSGKASGKVCKDTEEGLLSTFHNTFGYEMYCKGDYIGARVYSVNPADNLTDSSWDASSAADLLDNWHNITVTYKYDHAADSTKDGKLSVYFDGVLKSQTDTSAGVINYSNIPFIIGAGADMVGPQAGSYFTGKIDEVKVYDRALSVAEVESLYKSALVDAPSLETVDAGSNKVSWNSVAGIDVYKLYRSVSADGSYTEISSDAASPYLDSSVTSGTVYYYKLVLCKSGVCSARSAPVSLTTDAAPVPGSSGDITADNLSAGWLSLKWAAASDVLDPSIDLQYKVVMSTNDINTIGKCEEASVDIVQDWTYNMTAKAVSLPLNTEYYLNVLVKDLKGNKAAYTSRKMKISFMESNAIATNGANDWEYFTIDGARYLAAANFKSNSSYVVDSMIYKWNSVDSTFDSFKSIGATGGYSWQYFEINSEKYLALANTSNGAVRKLTSRIYKWNSVDSSFDHFKDMSTDGAVDWEFFTINGDHYLATANASDDASYNINSKIYKWNSADSSFDHYYDIATNGAQDLEYFTIGGDHYLAVANTMEDGGNRSLNSRIYKWNNIDSTFDHFKDISTDGAYNWQYFTIGGDMYLAVANYSNDSTLDVNSNIYKWNIVDSSFDHFQSIPTSGARDWQYFTVGSHSYLAVANMKKNSSFDTNSKIYRWSGLTFVDSQYIASSGATDWEVFTIGGDIYLALTNMVSGSNYEIDSKMYKLKLSLF